MGEGGGAEIDGCKPAGIAVGENVDRLAGLLARGDLANDFQPVPADAAVQFHILVGDLGGAPVGSRGAVGLGNAAQKAAHFIQRPAQIDCGGACLVELFPHRIECGIGSILAHAHGNAIGGQ